MQKTKFLKSLTVAFFIGLCFTSNAQTGLTSYSLYSFGINTSINKAVSAELKTFANRDVDDLLFEMDVFYNFEQKKHHRFSLGIGLNATPFLEGDVVHAFTIPAQLEIYPLQDFKKLSLLIELAPEYVFESDLNIRHLWGIRYTFGELIE